MRRLAVLLLCGTVLIGACREKPDPETPATTTAPPVTTQLTQPTTTPSTVDVSTPPRAVQLQDPAYWNAVLAALNHVVGDVFRSVVSTSAVAPSATDALRQVYGPPPGDLLATVTEVVKVEPGCVTLEAILDFTKAFPAGTGILHVLQLVPREPGAPVSINPTPWLLYTYFVVADHEGVGAGDGICDQA